MKISLFTWTWILRGLGVLCLLPLVFANRFVWYFPALDSPKVFLWLQIIGFSLFMGGAIWFYVLSSLEKKARRAAKNRELDSE